MKELVLRFVIGGLAVSAFAALGDVLKPKSFAGLFGAAPSIALATLGLTMHTYGKVSVHLVFGFFPGFATFVLRHACRP